jgi:Xaa-Pro aminopeptidase
MINKIVGDRPDNITVEEISNKLLHLGAVLDEHGYNSILLKQEGALRWLTGTKQQVIEVAPDAESPVWAEIEHKSGRFLIRFIADDFEMNRLRDEIPPIFDRIDNINIRFSTKTDYKYPEEKSLIDDNALYKEISGKILNPLIGAFEGNQYRKAEWLANASYYSLVTAARSIVPGMNGLQICGQITKNLNELGIEENLVLVGLDKQETHLHPIARSTYKIPKKGCFKIAIGSRYADMIYSGTLMVYIGGGTIPETVLQNYKALQAAALEYCDYYKSGISEKELYSGIYTAFRNIESRTGIKNFSDSAYLHHLGGPLSCLGNRDYIVSKEGSNTVSAWRQFAVNPVEALTYTKVEIQGLVLPEGGPSLFYCSSFCDEEMIHFSDMRSTKGTEAKLPEILKI